MISMHAGQPGTRRRSMARPVGGQSHSTVVAYEGDENDVTEAIRRAEQPASNNMALFAKPRAQFGMLAGARNRQHEKRREVAPSEVREEKSVTASYDAADEKRLTRRTQSDAARTQQWTQRGMFKLGFNSGSPRIAVGRKFTK